MIVHEQHCIDTATKTVTVVILTETTPAEDRIGGGADGEKESARRSSCVCSCATCIIYPCTLPHCVLCPVRPTLSILSILILTFGSFSR